MRSHNTENACVLTIRFPPLNLNLLPLPFIKLVSMILKKINHWILLLFTLFLFLFDSFSCTIDVVINQGNSVSLCPGAPDGLTATAGYVNYTWSGVAAGTGNTATATGNGWAYVDAEDNVGCISRDSILVSLYPDPNPVISSSEGLNICPAISGSTLSLNQSFTNYTWNDGSTSPTLFITESGSYEVVVTDANGCKDSAEVTINFVEFSLEAIGGTTVCSGSYLLLEAGGGDVYAWSTGEFSEAIVVAPQQPSTYSVTIYKGACFQTLSLAIDIAELPEFSMPDTIFVLPGQTEYAYGPANFDTYLWSPAENITATTGSSTGYTGTTSGNVTLVATSNTLGCSMTHTTHFKLIDLTIPQGFSPNGDGINDVFEIPEIYEFTAELKVWNRWGDVVFESDRYLNNWDGTCRTSLCMGGDTLPEGTYFYTLTIDGHRFEGYLTLKQ